MPSERTRTAVLRWVLEMIGYSPDVIDEIKAQLPDPVDAERDEPILARYSLTRGRLMEIMGASP